MISNTSPKGELRFVEFIATQQFSEQFLSKMRSAATNCLHSQVTILSGHDHVYRCPPDPNNNSFKFPLLLSTHGFV
ncbi:unnamed protein product [Caenorhabditis nigoni]